jgi:cytochrome P450
MIKEFCDNYLTDLVRQKNAAPQDDLLSRLIVEQMQQAISPNARS